MSLLMDALRKAEEAKKQAEQGDEDKPAEQSGAETPAAESTPASDETENTSIPDVVLEFEPETAPESGAETPAEADAVQQAVTEQPVEQDPESNSDSLSLEPIDEQLSSASRQAFDGDYTPDYSAELSAAPGPIETPEVVDHSKDDAEQEEAETGDADEVADVPDDVTSSSAPEYGVVVKDPEAVRAALSASHDKLQAREQLERAISESSSVQKTADAAEEDHQDEIGEAASKPEPIVPEIQDRLTLTPQKETISERSESSRSGAKNLFAAKRQGKGKRLRIRRSTKIWAAQITIVLMVAVGAYFYFFVVNNTADNFNVPEQFLANQDSFSENFNQSLEEPAVVEEPLAEETIPLDGDFGFEILQESEIDNADQVIAEVIPETPVDTDAALEPASVVTVQAGSSSSASEPAADEEEADDQEPLSTPAEALGEAESEVTQQLATSQGPSNSISFTRSGATGGVDPLLRDAYAAFQRDNLGLAQGLYQQVLEDSPRNRDALLGLAAIANSNGESNLAMELYSRLLARDPSDAVARAGLMGLRPLGGPEQQERELRRLMELHPQVAPVNYALGNFYAGQNRWTDAQRHYFNALQQAKTDALQGLPVNPDYAFNLAVSLEHLNQGAAAEVYYREAIAFAAEFPASFDVNIARERLLNLAEVSLR